MPLKGGGNLYNPSKDLTAVQNILVADSTILSLLNLSSASQLEKLKRIIRESTWNDLASNERRLCVYFRPSRKPRNIAFREEVLQVDCHVPAGSGFFAYQVLERVHVLLHGKKVNCRYLESDGQLGELPTMSGFFCCGGRYTFNRVI